MKKLLFLLPLILLVAWCGKQLTAEEAFVPFDVCNLSDWTLTDCSTEWAIVVRHCEFSGCITIEQVVPVIVEPTTWSVSIQFEPQPTKLAGNYQDNGVMLRTWSEDNIKTIDIPAEAKDVVISFKLAKPSEYGSLPWNIQASVGDKKLCNGRLLLDEAIDNTMNAPIYSFDITSIFTQDHPKWEDWSSAIGNTLTIKARVGEAGNRIEEITVSWTK